MKELKKKIILALVLLTIPIYYLGLYQKKEIKLGAVSVSKPFGYRFHSVSVNDNLSFLESLKNYLGVNTSFKIDDNIVILNFYNIFLNQHLHVSFRTSKNEKKTFSYEYNLNSDLYKTLNNCTFFFQTKTEDTNNLYEISGLFNETNTTFYILGDYKLDVIQMQESLCK